MIKLSIVAVALVVMGGGASAETFRLDLCQDTRVTGWSFYCDPEVPEEEEDTEKPVVTSTPQAAPKTATERMMEYRAMVDEAKYAAVLDPTPENVQNYMQVQKELGDRAGAFADQWQRVLYETPSLNANVDSPLAAAGISVYQDQMKAVREATLKRVAANHGLMFISNPDSDCGICRVQGQVLVGMERQYGVSVLPILKTQGTSEYFPSSMIDQGQLAKMGLEDFPAPTLALVNPDTKEVQVLGSGLVTADEILERVHVITEIPRGERY